MKPIAHMDAHELDAIAGEYVLGTLSPADRTAVQQALGKTPLLAAAVARWEERLLPLTGLVRPIEPPARLWSRIEASVGQVAPARSSRGSWWWNSIALWRSLAAGSMAAASILVAVLLGQVAQPRPQFVVVLVAPDDRTPGWVVQANDARQVSLIPLGQFELPPDKALQFWTKADDWQGPVSLGLVTPGQKVRISLDDLPPLQANQLFELTLEPATGSPTSRPTGPIQFIGRAVPTT